MSSDYPVYMPDDEPKPDDLFGKLDSLIQKHQGRFEPARQVGG